MTRPMPSHKVRSRHSRRQPSGSRSRSPARSPQNRHEHRDRHAHRTARSRSPIHSSRSHKHGEEHKRSHRLKSTSAPKPAELPIAKPLPYGSRQLHKHDLRTFEPIFTQYLDIQKQISVEDLDEKEFKGRWKRFVGKWNRGELAEGWYDPLTFRRAVEQAGAGDQGDVTGEKNRHEDGRSSHGRTNDQRISESKYGRSLERHDDSSEEDEQDFGPSLPSSSFKGGRHGPSIPNMQDLALRDEQAHETAAQSRADLHFERRAERRRQRDLDNEMVPRAEPGTRERQLEKKRETAAANRAFRDAKHGDGDGLGETPDADLMGGGGGGREDGVEGIKAAVRERERKRNEREIRREEALRARAAEREERMEAQRAKEEQTMRMLKSLARERFGGRGLAGDGGEGSSS